jgi:hypothetical protein
MSPDGGGNEGPAFAERAAKVNRKDKNLFPKHEVLAERPPHGLFWQGGKGRATIHYKGRGELSRKIGEIVTIQRSGTSS